MKTRLNIAGILNVVLPGTGLIVARREWLGVVIVGLFSVAVNLCILGLWIEPEWVPRQVLFSAAGAAAGCWLAAQWALFLQWRRLRDPSTLDQILTCYEVADRAQVHGRDGAAIDALRVALVVDDENVDTYARLARVSTNAGHHTAALEAWRRVRQLDRGGAYDSEARTEISRLKSGVLASELP